MSDWLQTITEIAILAATNAGAFLATSVLPIVVLCTILLMIGRWMNGRLLNSFGWKGVLALAWIGTPIHEFSHLLACGIGLNRVEDFALFKPDPQTGSMGYVKHSYRQDSFYQRIIGNTIIAIAPFIGGSLIIYWLTSTLYPDLLSGLLRIADIRMDDLGTWVGIKQFGEIWFDSTSHFIMSLFSAKNLGEWRFWIYLFAMISLAAHLSPSHSDFEGLTWPVIILAVLVFLVHLGLAIGVQAKWWTTSNLAIPLISVNALLILALLFLLIGAAITALLTSGWNLARYRHF